MAKCTTWHVKACTHTAYAIRKYQLISYQYDWSCGNNYRVDAKYGATKFNEALRGVVLILECCYVTAVEKVEEADLEFEKLFCN